MATISRDIKRLIFPPKTQGDIVSNNTKIVLFGLFALVAFSVLMYAITATGKYNPDNIKGIRAEQLQERFEAMDLLSGVYIAAISGSLALGGTLIAQLWGRSK